MCDDICIDDGFDCHYSLKFIEFIYTFQCSPIKMDESINFSNTALSFVTNNQQKTNQQKARKLVENKLSICIVRPSISACDLAEGCNVGMCIAWVTSLTFYEILCANMLDTHVKIITMDKFEIYVITKILYERKQIQNNKLDIKIFHKSQLHVSQGATNHKMFINSLETINMLKQKMIVQNGDRPPYYSLDCTGSSCS